MSGGEVVSSHSVNEPLEIRSNVTNVIAPFLSQVWRGRIHPTSRDLSSACQRSLSAVYFKLRRMRPCVLAHVSMQAELDEENELQLSIYGTAISLTPNNRGTVCNSKEKSGLFILNVFPFI